MKSIKITLLVLTLLFFWVNRHTWLLSHVNGDEALYLAATTKLDQHGFEHYNLRGIYYEFSGPTVTYTATEDPTEEGQLLKKLKSRGIEYYDAELLTIPPLFSYLMKLTHNLFHPNRPFMMIAKTIQPETFKQKLEAFWLQFYATSIPFACGWLGVLGIYLWSRRYINHRVGVWAAWMLSVSPVYILCSSWIWADTLVTLAVLIGITCYWASHHEKKLWLAIVAGIATGLACITKLNGFTAVIVAGVFHLAFYLPKVRSIRSLLGVLFHPYWLVYVLITTIIALPWYAHVASVYGNPLYINIESQPDVIQKADWFKLMHERPQYAYFVNIPVQTPFIFFILGLPILFWKKLASRKVMLFLLFWVAVPLYAIFDAGGAKLLRYMLPAYPALVVLSSLSWCSLMDHLEKRMSTQAVSILSIGLLVASTVWSLSIAYYHVIDKHALIPFPV